MVSVLGSYEPGFDVSVRVRGSESFHDVVTRARILAPSQVVDATTGTPLEGAAITVDGTAFHAFTGADGRFSFRTVPQGEHVWVIHRLGYATWEQPFTAAPFDQLRIDLMPRPVALENITVTVDRLEARRRQATISVQTVTPENLRSSSATVAMELMESRAPWAVVQCPDNLGATVYPLDQDTPRMSRPSWTRVSGCTTRRSSASGIGGAASNRPCASMTDPSMSWSWRRTTPRRSTAIDFVGGPRPQVRLYTEWFLEKRRVVRPLTIPCY